MFRCAQSIEKSHVEAISQGQPEAGQPVARTLWDPWCPPVVLLPKMSVCWGWEGAKWSLPAQGCLDNNGLGLSPQTRCEAAAQTHWVGSHTQLPTFVTMGPSKMWVEMSLLIACH